MAKHLARVALDLEGRAERDAPIKEGTLRGSASSSVEKRAGGGVRAVVSFSTPYAAVQHERRDFEHPRGGKAGYLGDNLKAMAPTYAQGLAAAARSALSGL